MEATVCSAAAMTVGVTEEAVRVRSMGEEMQHNGEIDSPKGRITTDEGI